MAAQVTRLRSWNPGIDNPDIPGIENPDTGIFDENLFDSRTEYHGIEAYQSARSARPAAASEETMPIFLSDYGDELEAQDFEQQNYEQDWQKKRRARLFSRIFASVLAAASAAILWAALSSDIARALIASASASIASVLPGPTAPAQNTATQLTARDIKLKDPTRLGAPANQTTVAVTPTRDEMTNAYQAALQSRAPVVAVPPAAAASPLADAVTARRLDADELAGILKRAKSLIAVGDIAPARLLLERAANAQDAGAALLLAQTYDPAVLGRADERSITPDPVMARSWYEKATRLGSADAQQRLSQIKN